MLSANGTNMLQEFPETLLNDQKIAVTPLRLHVLHCILEYAGPFTIEQVKADLQKVVEVDRATLSNVLILFNRRGLIAKLRNGNTPSRRGPGRPVTRYVRSQPAY
jgi:Fe2+ or Zn2+ uptake regulation protein